MHLEFYSDIDDSSLLSRISDDALINAIEKLTTTEKDQLKMLSVLTKDEIAAITALLSFERANKEFFENVGFSYTTLIEEFMKLKISEKGRGRDDIIKTVTRADLFAQTMKMRLIDKLKRVVQI